MASATAQELAVRTKVATVANTATLLQKVDSPGRLYAPLTKAQLIIDLGLSPVDGPTFDDLTLSNPSNIYALSHNSFAGVAANEHLNHTGISISAGTGLTGGGTIAANRTLTLDVPGLVVDSSPDENADYVLTYDASAATHKKVLLSKLPGGMGGPASSTDNAIARWNGTGGDDLQNSNLTISDVGLLTTDTEGIAFLGEEYVIGGEWTSPISVYDVRSDWDSDGNCIDEVEATAATHGYTKSEWWAELDFTVSECQCSKIQFLAKKEHPDDTMIVRGHYDDGSWHTVGQIEVTTTSPEWYEISLGGVRTITKFRLDFSGWFAAPRQRYLYEVEFYSLTETAQYKTTLIAGEPHADLALTLPIVDGSANQALKTNGSGVLSWGGHDDLADFAANEHFLQTAITNVSTALSTGLLKVTTGTGVLSVLQTDVTGAELEELTDGSQTTLHSHAGAGATFLDLTDTPNSYDSDDVGKVVRVKNDLSGLEFVEGVGGITTFTGLTDTPANYTGEAGKYAKVNVGEDGLEFDTPAGGGFTSRCSVYLSDNQSIPEDIATKVELDGEKYDDDDEFASYKFTAKEAGNYHVVVLARMNTGAGFYYQLAVRKNDAEIANFTRLVTGDGSASIGKDVYLEINDYLELFIFQDGVQARNIRGVANGHLTFMTIHRFA